MDERSGHPPEERDRLPLLAAGSEVVWVCGAGFADGLAPTADSENVLQMEAQKWRNNNEYARRYREVLVSEEQLKAKVAELRQISKDYEGKNLVLVSILKARWSSWPT